MSTRSQGIADAAYLRAVEAVREAGSASVTVIQAKTRATWNGAQEFLTRMEQEGIVGPVGDDGARPLLT